MDIHISNKSLKETIDSLGFPYSGEDTAHYNEILLDNIEKYLSAKGNSTIVVENDYVDVHFIEDFCGHYGRCFVSYNRKCVRLHFFNKCFSEDDFQNTLISESDANQVQEKLGEYLGYIVLRPIPASIFAKVCLSSPADVSAFSKIIRKSYHVHLCGLTFKVHTVAFQEQDHAISACATVALWMGFNAAPGINPRNVLSPYEISEIVRKHQVDGQLTHLVGKGLNIAQISSVINETDFESLAIRPATFGYLKAVVRAYLSMNIPIILGIDLKRRSPDPYNIPGLGKHAVTIIGYEGTDDLLPFRTALTKEVGPDDDVKQFFLESSAIRTLIVHDDHIGPFSKMTFEHEYGCSLDTEWVDSSTEYQIDAFIDVLAVMNVPKVRIRFSTILEITKELNGIVYQLYSDEKFLVSWDIRLMNVCSLKEEIRSLSEQSIDTRDKLQILTKSCPRYIWCVDLLIRDDDGYVGTATKTSSLYFDATDMENAGFFLFGLIYNPVGWISRIAFESLDVCSSVLSITTKQIQRAYQAADPSNDTALLT